MLSAEQRFQVCRMLCERADLPELWTESGPASANDPLITGKLGGAGSGERILVRAAWSIWTDAPNLHLSDVLCGLNARHLHLLGTLLVAMADGPDAVDEWLKYQARSSADDEARYDAFLARKNRKLS